MGYVSTITSLKLNFTAKESLSMNNLKMRTGVWRRGLTEMGSAKQIWLENVKW